MPDEDNENYGVGSKRLAENCLLWSVVLSLMKIREASEIWGHKTMKDKSTQPLSFSFFALVYFILWVHKE